MNGNRRKKNGIRSVAFFMVIAMLLIGSNDSWLVFAKAENINLQTESDTVVKMYAESSSTQNASEDTSVTTQAAQATTQAATTTEQTLDQAYYLTSGVSDDSAIMLKWFAQFGTASGYEIYRKCRYDADFQKIAQISAKAGAEQTYKDNSALPGIQFTYYVVPFHTALDGTHAAGGASNTVVITCQFKAPVIKKAARNGKKVKITWKKVPGVNGYEIYKTTQKKYTKVKSVGRNEASTTISNISQKKDVSVKMRAYVVYNNNYVYSGYSGIQVVYSNSKQAVLQKIRTLQKKYPSYYYWNHMGKKTFNSSTVTSKPCDHARYDMRYCNYYECPNGILGLQCYGFVWKMSDLIYGKKAKIQKFTSFDKADIGDIIRYQGHSVIIIEKQKEYVRVGECNIGDTCMILWGRKVTRAELKKAKYSRRIVS